MNLPEQFHHHLQGFLEIDNIFFFLADNQGKQPSLFFQIDQRLPVDRLGQGSHGIQFP